MEKKLLTCKEIAERYGVKIYTVWEWIRNGKLPAIQTGGPRKYYRIDPDDLAKFEASRKTNRTV